MSRDVGGEGKRSARAINISNEVQTKENYTNLYSGGASIGCIICHFEQPKLKESQNDDVFVESGHLLLEEVRLCQANSTQYLDNPVMQHIPSFKAASGYFLRIDQMAAQSDKYTLPLLFVRLVGEVVGFCELIQPLMDVIPNEWKRMKEDKVGTNFEERPKIVDLRG
ncbi:hypothetical protein Fot_29979 [Forsythia ovata]|uniref:Uncharacterized protein n=1 Tax=Forsythia ovata TaxID=205694 RepID=A0ABD1TTV7_9LAMI